MTFQNLEQGRARIQKMEMIKQNMIILGFSYFGYSLVKNQKFDEIKSMKI